MKRDYLTCIVTEKEYQNILNLFDYLHAKPPRAFHARHTRTSAKGYYFIFHAIHEEGLKQEERYFEEMKSIENRELPLFRILAGGNQPRKRRGRKRKLKIVKD